MCAPGLRLPAGPLCLRAGPSARCPGLASGSWPYRSPFSSRPDSECWLSFLCLLFPTIWGWWWANWRGNQISHIFVGTNTIHWPPHSRLRQPCLPRPTRSQPYTSLCHSQRCCARETSLRPTPRPPQPLPVLPAPTLLPSQTYPTARVLHLPAAPDSFPPRQAFWIPKPPVLVSPSGRTPATIKPRHPAPSTCRGSSRVHPDGVQPPSRALVYPLPSPPLHLTACHPFPASQLSPKPAHEMCAVR